MYSRRANFKFSASTDTSDRLSLLSQFSKVCEIAQMDVATHYPIALTTSKDGECIYDAWHPGAWEAAMNFLKMAERDGVIKIISPKTISDETEALIQRFDSAVLPQWENHPVPTCKSIVHIESSLGFQLPHELITFARLSSSYGSFFLSLGEDYTSDSHIIEKNRSIRADASWLKKATPAPGYLIFITNNFMSDHFWCLDTREKNITYPVVLWSPYLRHEQENMQYKNFNEFVVSQIQFYEKSQGNTYL